MTAARSSVHRWRAKLGEHAPDLGLVTFALALAWLVKHRYTVATADELRFILAPTAWLSGALLGHDFVWLPDAGYLASELSFLIAPACAGVNFLIIAFVALVVGFGPRFESSREKALFLAASALVAYGAAVLVNSLRIVLSVVVASQAARHLGLSFQAAHRVLGVTVYLGGLLVLVLVADLALRGPKRTARTFRHPVWLALGAYLGVTLLVPLLRGAGNAPEYWDHAGAVAPLALALAGAAFGIRALVAALHRRASVR